MRPSTGSLLVVLAVALAPAAALAQTCTNRTTQACTGGHNPYFFQGVQVCSSSSWGTCTPNACSGSLCGDLSPSYLTGTKTNETGASFAITTYPGDVLQLGTSTTIESGINESSYTFYLGLSGGTFAVNSQIPSGFSVRYSVNSGAYGIGSSASVTTNVGDQPTINWRYNPVTVVNVSGPSPMLAGSSYSVTVEARDAYGFRAIGYRGTIHLTSSDAAATLPADHAFVAGDNGTSPFSGVVLRTAGTQSITATDIATGSIIGTMSGITVTPGPATSYVFSGPSTVGAGTSFSVTVDAREVYNNRATGYTGPVKFSTSDTQGTVPAGNLPLNAGYSTFTNGVVLRTAGTQTVTVTDSNNSALTKSISVVVTPATASSLVLSGISSPRVACLATSPVVAVRDKYGNAVTGYRGTVTFSATPTDAVAVLPANYTFTAADNGSHTFTNALNLKTSGTALRTVTATDTVTSTINGSENNILVTPAAAGSIGVAGITSPIIAGVASDVVVTAYDTCVPGTNIATGYTGTVSFTSSDTKATLPSQYPFVPGDNGRHPFTGGVVFKTSGSQSVTAKDTATQWTSTQSGVQVNAASAATIIVTGIASSSVAGSSQTPTVELRDIYSNRATGYRGTVHFAATDPQASVPADYTFTAAESGYRTYPAPVVLKTSGAQNTTVSDSANSLSTPIGSSVASAAASQLVLTGIASPTTAGSNATVRVDARDPFSNLASAYAATVTFTSSDARAVVPPPYQFTTNDAGSHAFTAPLALQTAGSQAVTVTDNSTPTALATTQPNISVVVGPAANLVVTLTPSAVTAGSVSTVRVEAHDTPGNIVTTYSDSVGVTSTDPRATFAPTVCTFMSGVCILQLTARTSGSQIVTAIDSTYGSIRGSATLAVSPGIATSFVLANMPSQATAGVPMQFTVIAKDANQNIASSHVGGYTLGTSDGAATLSPNLSFAPADQGVTTACCITLETAGTQTITATDVSDHTLTASGSVPVVAGALNRYSLQMVGVVYRAGWLSTATLIAYDAAGNVKTDYRGTAHFTSTDSLAHLPADYAFVSSDNGSHTFIHQTTFGTVGAMTLTAADGATSSTAAASVQAAPPAPSPGTLVVYGLTGTGLVLQWTDFAPGTDSYNVKQGLFTDQYAQSIYLAQNIAGAQNSQGMSYPVTGLTSGQGYNFWVEAVGPTSSTNATPRVLGYLSESITNTPAMVAPQITVSPPTDQQAVASASLAVTVRYSSVNAAVSPSTFSTTLNGALVSGVTAGASSASGTVTLQRGTNTLTFSIADVVGNVGSVSLTVYYDINPPTITMTTPTDAAVTTSSSYLVTGTVTADDPSPTVIVNNVPASVAGGAFNASISLGVGLNSVKATATDRTGKTASTAPVRLFYYPSTGQLSTSTACAAQ